MWASRSCLFCPSIFSSQNPISLLRNVASVVWSCVCVGASTCVRWVFHRVQWVAVCVSVCFVKWRIQYTHTHTACSTHHHRMNHHSWSTNVKTTIYSRMCSIHTTDRKCNKRTHFRIDTYQEIVMQILALIHCGTHASAIIVFFVCAYSTSWAKQCDECMCVCFSSGRRDRWKGERESEWER